MGMGPSDAANFESLRVLIADTGVDRLVLGDPKATMPIAEP